MESSSTEREIMAGLGSAVRRHRAAVAANLALLLAVTGIVYYAVSADGYRSHRAELNDGGIWATNPRLGYFGRVNKQIGQYDGAVFAESGAALDVVQQDAAVVGVDLTSRRIAAIDPAKVAEADGDGATLPSDAQIRLAGGTLAVLDARNGELRATRVDTVRGASPVSEVDGSADPLAQAGARAALTVTEAGTVFAISADQDTLTRVDPAGSGFTRARRTPLAVPLGDSVALTAVGQQPVSLDPTAGSLAAIGGARAVLEPGSVLQQPGPDAPEVLAATGSALVAVDLATGTLSTVADGVSGTPAEPVRLAGCVYGAWSGSEPAVVARCGDEDPTVSFLDAPAGDLVFRVNRGEILLNDRLSGAVWSLDDEVPTRLDDWEAFTQREKDKDDNPDKTNKNEGNRRPPKAKPDQLGARPGRTTVLHPLDNDSAPEGRVLSIRSVNPVAPAGSRLSISPDGQTVQIQLPAGTTRPLRFQYVVDDGRPNVAAKATVTVTPRDEGQNQPPRLRPGYKERVWAVPAGGSIALPVLADWRDRRDGDPLAVVDATTAEGSGATVRATADGRVRFTAPQQPGQVKVAYAVADGRSAPVTQPLTFKVQDPETDKAVAAVAEPDIVGVETGRWITIRPLANDLPGADPLVPQAELELAGRLGTVPGAQVRTDLAEGTVSFRSTVARTYSLPYQAAYGNAPLARGRIRIDVQPRDRRAPVAMPDTTTVFGASATLVDVLANDVDPAGGLLVVQDARALQPEQVDVAVVDGRWVRVAASEGELASSPQVVRYTVSNGTQAAVGEITVNQREVPRDNSPVTEVDRVTVRVGAGAAIPVLDNDFSPSGDALTLVSDVVGESAGQLEVRSAVGAVGARGQAFVSGRLVRYVAPAQLAEPETFTIEYLASNTRGDTAPGRVQVTVIPDDRPNRVPEPPLLEGRVASGGNLTIKLPGTGVDPDGDAVTVIGLASAPRLGRVLGTAATSIRYQAYPGSAGTEEFEYLLSDSRGGRATGTVRIAVAPPTSPMPPVALPDVMTVEPGRVATVEPMANDVVAVGDRVTIELVDPPDGVTLASPSGPVHVEAPARADGRTVDVVYRLSNGLATSQATITLRTATPYNNPPVVFESFGRESDAATVRLDLLRSAYDPDGPTEALRITHVYAPAGVEVQVNGGRLVVAKGDVPLVIPFRVEDADGGAAMAQAYVPALGTGLPYVRDDALIRVDPGESIDAELEDYVVNPGGAPLRFTAAGGATGSPLGAIDAASTGASTFTVHAGRGYSGPGAVTFEVTDTGNENAPGAQRVVLSVPVVVGETTPVLRCPTDPLTVNQGDSIDLDIHALCNVFTTNPAAAVGLRYTATWERQPAGLTLTRASGTPIVVSAGADARAGREGVLLVVADGSDPARIRIRVGAAPAPTLAPIQVNGLRAGQSRTVNLAPYLTSGVPDPQPTVVSVRPVAGRGVTADPVGGSRVRLVASDVVSGNVRFRVVMSDVQNGRDPRRQATNLMSMDLTSVPERPRPPIPGSGTLNGEVRLSWAAPIANGAPITYYELRANNGRTIRCPATACTFGGLTNGTSYTFAVRAHNAIGWSEWSAASRGARPDTVPGAVGSIGQIKQGDGQLRIRWTRPTVKSSVSRYLVVWPNGGRASTTATTLDVFGLDNDRAYRFTVYAINAKGRGPGRTSGPLQSAGNPGTPQAPTIVAQPSGSGDAATLVVTWPTVDQNGPNPVRYTLLYDGFAAPGCAEMLQTRCIIGGVSFDGTEHTFKVISVTEGYRNNDGATSTWKAVATPANWGAWSWEATGTSREVKLSFTVPNSRGSQSNVTIFAGSEVLLAESIPQGPRVRTVLVPDNNGPHAVHLRVCNGAGLCSESTPRQVQSYGPLADVHLRSIVADRDGTRVSWQITADTNGAPARLVVESDQRSAVSFNLNGVDEHVVSTGYVDLGWSTTENITVTLVDGSARNRGPVVKTASVKTPDPPDPVVTVRRGTLCSDEAGSPRPPCNVDGSGADCTDASCGFVEVEVANFLSPVTCRLTAQGTDQERVIGPIPDNSARETVMFYGVPGNWVQADCTGTPETRQDSDRYTWPGA